jgi:hypothetical protein
MLIIDKLYVLMQFGEDWKRFNDDFDHLKGHISVSKMPKIIRLENTLFDILELSTFAGTYN